MGAQQRGGAVVGQQQLSQHRQQLGHTLHSTEIEGVDRYSGLGHSHRRLTYIESSNHYNRCGAILDFHMYRDQYAVARTSIYSLVSIAVRGESGVEEIRRYRLGNRHIEGSSIALIAKTNRPRSITLVLDSGASEFMFNNTNLAHSLESSNRTKIVGASGPVASGKYGKSIDVYFPGDHSNPVKIGTHNKAVFSGDLEDNLASVGRLCEGGYIVVFHEDKYRIYKSGNIRVEGKFVHEQHRDPHTGLYPLTLETS